MIGPGRPLPTRLLENSDNNIRRSWDTAPTAKEKSAVQRSVTQLLNVLAPERAVKRGETQHGWVGQHRTPAGCVLQAESAAVSVSWFADSRAQTTVGELHVNVWNGVVSRGGSSYRKPAKASIVTELVLKPMEMSDRGCVWRADDGREFDNNTLAALCNELLDQQVAVAAN